MKEASPPPWADAVPSHVNKSKIIIQIQSQEKLISELTSKIKLLKEEIDRKSIYFAPRDVSDRKKIILQFSTRMKKIKTQHTNARKTLEHMMEHLRNLQEELGRYN